MGGKNCQRQCTHTNPLKFAHTHMHFNTFYQLFHGLETNLAIVDWKLMALTGTYLSIFLFLFKLLTVMLRFEENGIQCKIK